MLFSPENLRDAKESYILSKLREESYGTYALEGRRLLQTLLETYPEHEREALEAYLANFGDLSGLALELRDMAFGEDLDERCPSLTHPDKAGTLACGTRYAVGVTVDTFGGLFVSTDIHVGTDVECRDRSLGRAIGACALQAQKYLTEHYPPEDLAPADKQELLAVLDQALETLTDTSFQEGQTP